MAYISRQARSPPKRWIELLDVTYDGLRTLGANDIWVFGSQAMSLHMKTRPLASKDLDLIATGVTNHIMDGLRELLLPYSSGRPPDYEYHNTTYETRSYPVYSISIIDRDQRPFIIELFGTYRGYDVRRLTPYATFVKKWKNTYQTLTIEGIIGTRLAFRQPEGISSLNAKRLNNFIGSVREEIHWDTVDAFVRDFQLEDVILKNLGGLHRRNLKITDSEKLSFVSKLQIYD